MKTRIISLVYVSLLFCGCATTLNYENILQSWVGNHVDQLVSSWGPPQSSYTLSDGGRIIEYTNQSTSQVGGYTYMSPQTTYSTGSANISSSNGSAYGTYSGTSTTFVQKQAPIYNLEYNCTTRFAINKNGIITKWTWQGNNCVALASDVNNLASYPDLSTSNRLQQRAKVVKPSMEPIGLYKQASSESERLQSLKKDDSLLVESVSGEWFKVHTSNGKQGWVMRSLVR